MWKPCTDCEYADVHDALYNIQEHIGMHPQNTLVHVYMQRLISQIIFPVSIWEGKFRFMTQ